MAPRDPSRNESDARKSFAALRAAPPFPRGVQWRHFRKLSLERTLRGSILHRQGEENLAQSPVGIVRGTRASAKQFHTGGMTRGAKQETAATSCRLFLRPLPFDSLPWRLRISSGTARRVRRYPRASVCR